MANVTINSLPVASTIDAVNDYLPIFTAIGAGTQAINRNTLLGLSSAPVGLTDSQTLTNKILTSPTINGATLSGTLSGTYTIGGTPTFPASVTQNTTVQTLTNKTLTSPTINSPSITNATISTDTITGYTVSNTGTIYGVSVATGVIASAALNNSVNTAAIQSSAVTMSKFSNTYIFSAYMSATQTLTNAGQLYTLAMNTKEYDLNTNYSTSTYGYTVPFTGYYQFGLMAQLQAQAGAYFILSLGKNSTTEYRRIMEIPNTTGNITTQGTADMYLTAGDVIYPLAWSGTAGKVIGSGVSVTKFWGRLITL